MYVVPGADVPNIRDDCSGSDLEEECEKDETRMPVMVRCKIIETVRSNRDSTRDWLWDSVVH